MIVLPDFSKSFDYENNFHLSCDVSRMRKVIIHYELFKMTSEIPGTIVECGVFKGVSLARFAIFRALMENNSSRKIIGFDIFGKYPQTKFEPDKTIRKEFIEETGGGEGISLEQMITVLKHKKCDKNTELIEGDICQTVPRYLKVNPQLKISLLNLDTDIYEPAVAILEYFWPRIQKGGVLILDDYCVFPGETKAIDDYFQDKAVNIRRFPFCSSPSYIIKE